MSCIYASKQVRMQQALACIAHLVGGWNAVTTQMSQHSMDRMNVTTQLSHYPERVRAAVCLPSMTPPHTSASRAVHRRCYCSVSCCVIDHHVVLSGCTPSTQDSTAQGATASAAETSKVGHSGRSRVMRGFGGQVLRGLRSLSMYDKAVWHCGLAG